MKGYRLLLALALSLAFTLALLWSVGAVSPRAAAAILYVSATDPACGGSAPCYATLQAAVNAAVNGDEVRVAAGTYTGSASVVVGINTYTQVVAIINKTLTLAGGYTNTNWTTPDLMLNTTNIDAEQHGRGVTIIGTGTQTVTVSGFTIYGGDYTGLGNPPGVGNEACVKTGADCGGGLYAYWVRLFLLDSVIVKNTASRNPTYSDGGGAFLIGLKAGSRVENTLFSANTTRPSYGGGGGAYVDSGSGITFAGCRFEDNTAYNGGGGLTVWQLSGEAVIEDTEFISNTSQSEPGGALRVSLIQSDEALHLNRVTMQGNKAWGAGAAIYLVRHGGGDPSVAEMTNILLTGSSLIVPAAYGSVVDARGGSGGALDIRLAHATFADNLTPAALRLATYYAFPVTATLTNTLVVSATTAFVGAERDAGEGNVTIRHTKTLRQYVATLHAAEAGTPDFQSVSPVTGSARLDATYHLRRGSAAIDAGVDAGVTTDMDGQLRPIGSAPDIGADEALLYKFLPVVMRRR